jgi:hypothetical protein
MYIQQEMAIALLMGAVSIIVGIPALITSLIALSRAGAARKKDKVEINTLQIEQVETLLKTYSLVRQDLESEVISLRREHNEDREEIRLLKVRVLQMEDENRNFRRWANRLVNQVIQAGLEPEPFVSVSM